MIERWASLLVVDDEPDNFDVIEILLSGEPYQLYYAASGRRAIDRLPTIRPDVILLDAMMPDLNGLEVCQQLKADPTWQHIPIIMVTALNSKEDMAHCLEAGADDFVSKPVNCTELRARVRSMLRIKRQYDQLQMALKSMQATLQWREDLSHMIVHDLRSPVSNILVTSELMLRADLSGRQQQRAERIMLAGQQLRFLTDDLLLMARLEAGKLSLNPTDTDPVTIAAQVLADFQPLAQEKSIQLLDQFPAEGAALPLDRHLLHRICDNLLSNALKFSPPGSVVRVQLDYPAEPDIQIRLQIADQGPGVDAELHQRIFEKYEIGQLRQEIPQTGLGLAFCRIAVEAHGGKIRVTPNQPQGSIFIVEI